MPLNSYIEVFIKELNIIGCLYENAYEELPNPIYFREYDIVRCADNHFYIHVFGRWNVLENLDFEMSIGSTPKVSIGDISRFIVTERPNVIVRNGMGMAYSFPVEHETIYVSPQLNDIMQLNLSNHDFEIKFSYESCQDIETCEEPEQEVNKEWYSVIAGET